MKMHFRFWFTDSVNEPILSLILQLLGIRNTTLIARGCCMAALILSLRTPCACQLHSLPHPAHGVRKQLKQFLYYSQKKDYLRWENMLISDTVLPTGIPNFGSCAFIFRPRYCALWPLGAIFSALRRDINEQRNLLYKFYKSIYNLFWSIIGHLKVAKAL